MSIGDTIEYIIDPSIKDIREYTLIHLPIYTSSNDNTTKSIISMDAVTDDIFVDDIEFFISGQLSNGQRIGSYFPRLSIPTIRQLTYKDWSLNSQLINNAINTLSQFKDVNQVLSNISIHVIRRDNKQTRISWQDNNNIGDLMNLSSLYRQQALSGVNANLSIWQANTLETCPLNIFTELVYADLNYISMQYVYSRKAAQQYLELPYIKPNATQYSLPIISGNAGGILLTFDPDGSNATINSISANTPNYTYSGKGYELFFPGLDSTSSLDLLIPANNTDNVVVDYGFDIFVYYKDQGTLLVATLNQDYFLVDSISNDPNTNSSTAIHWNNVITQYDRYVRTAQSVVMFTKTVSLSDMVNGIDVYNNRIRQNDIGMETLFVFLNGKYLIQNLDYVLYNGIVYVISKPDYFSDPSTITVIYAGLPNQSLSFVPEINAGFVQFGKVAVDGKYELLPYRDKLFFINGNAVSINDLATSENYQDITNNNVTYQDGSPYAVVSRPHYVRQDIIDNICQSKAAEIIKDTNISNFLSIVNPQPIPTGNIVIPNRYQVVSQILHRLITDIVSGVFPEIVDNEFTNDEVVTAMTGYLYLLHIEPMNLANIDSKFVVIIPTWSNTIISVNANEFAFITAVNNVILNNSVEFLNHYINVI